MPDLDLPAKRTEENNPTMPHLIDLESDEVSGKAVLPYVPRSRGQAHYHDSVSQAILEFHFNPRLDWADLYARLMRSAVPLGAECITFPPQKPDEDWTAGRALAEALGRLMGLPCMELLFYAEPPKRKPYKVKCPRQLTNRRIVVVDDMWRTGSSMAICAQALTAAGAQYVSALCLAKVASRERSPEEISADQQQAQQALKTVGKAEATGQLENKAQFLSAVAELPSVAAAHSQPISQQLWRITAAVNAYAEWTMQNLDGAAPLYGDATETRESFQGFTDALMEILRKGPFAEEGAEEFPVHEGLRLVGDDGEQEDD